MSKRKKPMSADEKRDTMLRLLYAIGEVFYMKELVKLGTSHGVGENTVEDVVRGLLSDRHINDDKIGSGCFFWSFPSSAFLATCTETWGMSQPSAAAFARALFFLQRFADGTTLLEAKPLTGRTNQIRIHCAYLGYAVVGDAAYANGDTVPRQTLELGEPPLCLHAWQISFAHPVSGVAVTFTAPPPQWALSTYRQAQETC